MIWIAGVIWSGKTTLTNELTAHLQQSNLQPILLDGDILRKVLKTSQITVDAHNRKSRIKLALKYAQMYELLLCQGFTVVIATISMFNEVYAWKDYGIVTWVYLSKIWKWQINKCGRFGPICRPTSWILFDFGFWDPAIYLAESCSLSCSCIIRIRKKSIRVLHYEYCLLLLCPRHSSSRTYYDVEWIYHKGHLQKFFLTSAHFNLFFIFSILALLDKSIFGFVKWKWYESVLC